MKDGNVLVKVNILEKVILPSPLHLPVGAQEINFLPKRNPNNFILLIFTVMARHLDLNSLIMMREREREREREEEEEEEEEEEKIEWEDEMKGNMI